MTATVRGSVTRALVPERSLLFQLDAAGESDEMPEDVPNVLVVESRFTREGAGAADDRCFARWVERGEPGGSFHGPDAPGELHPLRDQVDQRAVHRLDLVADACQLGHHVARRSAFCHAASEVEVGGIANKKDGPCRSRAVCSVNRSGGLHLHTSKTAARRTSRERKGGVAVAQGYVGVHAG